MSLCGERELGTRQRHRSEDQPLQLPRTDERSEERSCRRRGILFHFFEELVDALGVFLRVVEREVELGDAAELQALENFVANVVGGVFEGLDGAFLFSFGAAGADIDTGVAAVRSEADLVNDNRNLQARVFEFAGQHGVDLVGDFLADAFATVVDSGHGRSFAKRFCTALARATQVRRRSGHKIIRVRGTKVQSASGQDERRLKSPRFKSSAGFADRCDRAVRKVPSQARRQNRKNRPEGRPLRLQERAVRQGHCYKMSTEWSTRMGPRMRWASRKTLCRDSSTCCSALDRVTMPMVELCQTSWKSSSAMAMLNLRRRRALRLRRIWRLSLREWASGSCRSRSKRPTGMAESRIA